MIVLTAVGSTWRQLTTTLAQVARDNRVNCSKPTVLVMSSSRDSGLWPNREDRLVTLVETILPLASNSSNKVAPL
jgi:hypothetical protein